MYDKKFTIEQMITGSFVKYNRLSQLIQESFAGSTCENINLFIDATSAVKQLYSIDAWGYSYSNKFELAATLLNMCGHYRAFFSGLGVKCRIFIIYGKNTPATNNNLVDGYNRKFKEAFIKKFDATNLINENATVLSLITQFIPGIYFYDIGECEVSSAIDHIIGIRCDSLTENIVISKDVLALELVPLWNARIIRPIKTKEGDESIIVDRNNMWNMFFSYYRKVSIPDKQIPICYFQNFLAMTRVPERSIPSVFGIPKATHIISTACENRFLNPEEGIISQASMNTALDVMDVPHNGIELDMRFKAISTRYQSMYVIPIEAPAVKALRMVDLEDVSTLKQIIATYFSNCPIDLNKL